MECVKVRENGSKERNRRKIRNIKDRSRDLAWRMKMIMAMNEKEVQQRKRVRLHST